MKKAVKGMIGLTAVLALLCGGVAVLKMTEPENKDESSAESSEAYGANTLILENADIDRIKLKNSSGELNIIQEKDPSDESASSYTIEGYEDAPIEKSELGIIANYAKGLTSKAIAADDCSDLSKYGLDEPSASAEIHYASGKTVTLFVGNKVPTGTDMYVKTSEDNTVYTVNSSAVSNYSNEISDFVSKKIHESYPTGEEPTVLDVRIKREDIDYDIYLAYDKNGEDTAYGGSSAAHVMLEPVSSYLAVEGSTPIITGLFGLAAESVYRVHPTESDIAEAGLAEPFCRTEINCDNGEKNVFLMSEPYMDENGKKLHYAMLEGGKVIYTVSADNAKWATVKPIDISSVIFIGSYVWSVAEMKISGTNVTVDNSFVMTPTDPSMPAGDRTVKTVKTTRNGKEFDTERFRQYYSLLIQAEAQEFAIGEKIPSSEPIMKLEIYDSTKDESSVIEFYDYSALSSLIVVNGESKYFCSKSFVEVMAENANKFETGEDFTETWK